MSLDFGKATANNCEVKPAALLSSKEESEGLLRLNVSQLNKHESLYVACLLTQPTFKQILVAGGNLTSERKLTKEEYVRDPEAADTPVFLIFFFISRGLAF